MKNNYEVIVRSKLNRFAILDTKRKVFLEDILGKRGTFDETNEKSSNYSK